MMSSPLDEREELSRLGQDWVLILGGVTRSGHRRAQRVAREALSLGRDVVWFEGSTDADTDMERAPGPATLTFVAYGDDLSETLSGRLRRGDGLRDHAVGRQLWRLLRKIGGLLQPRACWQVIESDVRSLANETPSLIVYTDDQAITSAWHASRLWADTPVTTDLAQDTS